MRNGVSIRHIDVLSQGWIKLRRYTFDYRRRDGRTETLVREVHDHGHGAAVLPYDAGRDTVLLVRQFRLPAALHDGTGDLIEACAGLLENESPGASIQREAREELGFRLHNLRQVAACYTTPGAVTEHLTLFLADYGQGDRIAEGGGSPGEGEDIEILELSRAEVRHLLASGQIRDAKTIMLILFLERELLRV